MRFDEFIQYLPVTASFEVTLEQSVVPVCVLCKAKSSVNTTEKLYFLEILSMTGL